jgi:hypothetical protein
VIVYICKKKIKRHETIGQVYCNPKSGSIFAIPSASWQEAGLPSPEVLEAQWEKQDFLRLRAGAF